jgi:hypothetical protein
MKHDEVPTTFPFTAYCNGIGTSIEEVTVLEYGLSSPDCTTKTFLCKGTPPGYRYRTSIGRFFLTRKECLREIQADVRKSIADLEKYIVDQQNDLADLRNQLEVITKENP